MLKWYEILGMQDYLVQKADQPIENGGQVEGRVA
jgi:hypothetical protein